MITEDKRLRAEYFEIREKLEEEKVSPKERKELKEKAREINKALEPIAKELNERSENLYSQIMDIPVKKKKEWSDEQWDKKIEENKKVLEETEKKLKELKEVDRNIKKYLEDRIKQKREELLKTEAPPKEKLKVEEKKEIEPEVIPEEEKSLAGLEGEERIQAEKEIPRPWEAMAREEEGRVIDKYTPRVELSKESQKFIDDSLREEGERRRIEFAKKWFEEHREELRAEGISLEVSEERKVGIALERGAFKELKRKGKYREEYEQIENFNTLRLDLGKEHLPTESQFLLLNFLDKKAEEMRQEIEKMRKEGKPATEMAIKQRELDRLFEAQKELAQKASGRDLEGEAREMISSEEPKEKYVETRLEERKIEVIKGEELRLFEKEWQELSEKEKEKYENNPLDFAESRIESICRQLRERKIEIDKEECLALLSAGYNPEEFRRRGILRRSIEIKRGELLSKRGFFEFLEDQKERFSKKIEKEIREDLENEWEGLVRKEIEDRIAELAKSPERATDGIEGVYRKVKERLLAEWVERDLKKEPKGKAKLEKIERELSKGGENPREFISDIISRRGSLSELTGDLEKDAENLLEFFSGYGLNLKEEDIKGGMDQAKYREMVRRERGFLDFLLEFVFGILGFLVEVVEKQSEKERK